MSEETKKTKIGYYPGCAITKCSTSEEYGTSVLGVSRVIGPELVEIDDWNCCGASSGHATNHKLSTALSVRNISLAEKDGYDEVLAPCPMCSQRLIVSQDDVENDEKLREEVEDAIEMPISRNVKVSNYLEIVKNYSMEEIAEKQKKKPEGLKVASYYGCLLVRPPKILKFDDPENPKTMDDIVKAIGAEAVDWEFKTSCCGGGFTLSRTDVVVKLTSSHIYVYGAVPPNTEMSIPPSLPPGQLISDIIDVNVKSSGSIIVTVPLTLTKLLSVTVIL